ncbi:MAG: VanZ family protein [Bacteroidales bacterium]|nr:VanZ family protein [Bacteroidales bacterium]MCF8405799.1 VanZ family protein [Bacteroidales bacterium]
MKRYTIFLFLAIIIAILGTICSNDFIQMIASIFGMNVFWIKKIGHVIIFFTISFLSSLKLYTYIDNIKTKKRKPRMFIFLFTSLSILSYLLELTQHFISNRKATFTDWFFSEIGIILGIIVIHYCYKSKKLKIS